MSTRKEAVVQIQDTLSSPSTMKKQKRLGPAPIASFEDIQEDRHRMDSNGQSSESRLPDIKEHDTPKKPSPINTAAANVTITSSANVSLGILTPSTPRIDISRASSSSHHDSRDSSPENVFEQVGTGTLQDSGVLGYREEGTMDLRSSTEELYFMEPEKGKTECEKPQPQQIRHSPIMFKFDEQQQSCLQQHQRKDSASSEVAAFLCISGRTSRISSVGSQGSANSKLSAVSAVSGVSRSPSPHRMLLETSFCGPKPLEGSTDGSMPSSIEPSTAKMLEQVILARKQDPTQAVIAEGIKIDTHSVKLEQNGKDSVPEAATVRRKSEMVAKTPEVKITKPQTVSVKIPTTRKHVSKKDLSKPIVGVTPSGVEYYRIKLKPDHCYNDNGLGENERILEKESQRKPGSLDLDKSSSIGRNVDAIKCASPKPARHVELTRENGSRSPSPATITVSRKSSFCSLFKLKDNASPDSPTSSSQRKKSGVSLLSKDGFETKDQSRTRSKSRDRDRETPNSQNSTPNKQKSVLAIFKPKRNGVKSKSPSPIEPEAASSLDGISNVEFKFQTEPKLIPSSAAHKSRPREKLRYYDTPLDGKSIHIPLHTPPEEKDMFKPPPKKKVEIKPVVTIVEKPMPAKPPNVYPKASVPEKIKPKPPVRNIRKENPDGSIIIPLRSPTEEKEPGSLWSVEVQRHSSQESQETVISSHVCPSESNALSNSSKLSNLIINDNNLKNQDSTSTEKSPVSMLSAPTPDPPPSTPIISTMTAKEKKHILFSMRLGSGSEEQIFTTQLSLSKTESQSSQLSEQASVFDSPTKEREPLQRSETVIRKEDNIPPAVILRAKQADNMKRRSQLERSSSSQGDPLLEMIEKKLPKDDLINSNRHSRYIENPEEIMEAQQKLEALRRKKESKKLSDDSSASIDSSRDEVTIKSVKKSEPVLKLPEPPNTDRRSFVSTDEPGGSSESEKDSEMDSNRARKHLLPNMATIEDHESAGLVLQESFDDELPYIPTTLPEERSVGVKLVSVKERSQIEVKTCPLERPRSTTPINPASLENYCGITNQTDDNDGALIRGEKLRISLPRKSETFKEKSQKAKSPRRVSNSSGKNWFEFAEQGIGSVPTAGTPGEKCSSRKNSTQEEEPPPLPPRKAQNITQWVNFENIPEKRKPPKRITTLPQKDPSLDKNSLPQQNILYNYVNPEECQCECHESERESSKQSSSENEQQLPEETQPLLEPDLVGDALHDRSSMSDGSTEYNACIDNDLVNQATSRNHHYSHHHHNPDDVDRHFSRPFGMDLSVGHANSNRSSVVSHCSLQEDLHSPDLSSPNDKYN